MEFKDILNLLNPIFRKIDGLKEDLIDQTIELTEIPAPPFAEAARAEFVMKKFKKIGYRTYLDGIGNVIANKISINSHPPIIVMAHLDTVFGQEIEINVTRENDILKGPGVGDDTRGLINLIIIAKLLKDIEINRTIYFIANVGEEGEGDLRGTKYLFEAEEHKNKFPIHVLITIDGAGNHRIIDKSIGSKRYRIHFHGPGGHSYGGFGIVNPTYALGHFIFNMSQIKVPSIPRTTYSIGIIKGGTSVNSIPFHISTDIDLRSESSLELNNLIDKVFKLVLDAKEYEMNCREGEITFEIEKIGDRPAGKLDKDDPIRKLIKKVNNYFDIITEFNSSSTDANIPHKLGITAIAISGVDISGGAHSLNEWIDAGESSLITIKRNLLLLVSLAN